VSFADKVAAIYGAPLTGSTAAATRSTRSTATSPSTTAATRPTSSRSAASPPSASADRAGQAALIAAGMPSEEALKQRGGLYNVGNHQIIFRMVPIWIAKGLFEAMATIVHRARER
jgi:hypothetical protein